MNITVTACGLQPGETGWLFDYDTGDGTYNFDGNGGPVVTSDGQTQFTDCPHHDDVDQGNNGQNDDTYRRFVIARIATNFSNGTRETMIRIAQLILNDANAKVVVNNLGPAAASVRIDDSPVTDTLASILISFLRQATDVGIQINLQSSPNPIADQFALGCTAYAAIDIAPGANTIVVESTAGFPASGTLDIDFGLGVQEQVSYRLLDDVSFTLRAPTVNDHAIRAAVQLVDPSTGKGLGTIFDAGQPSLVPYANVGTIGGTLIDQRI